MGISLTKKYYTDAEIQRHTTIDSCWVVMGNKVYDITNLLDIHSGESNMLLKEAGMDVTLNYKYHSKKSKKKWKDYLIGYKN